MPKPVSSMQHNTWHSSVCSHSEEMQRLSIFGLCIPLFAINMNSNWKEEAELRNAMCYRDEKENAFSSILRPLRVCTFKKVPV